jgi:hypothetical protein
MLGLFDLINCLYGKRMNLLNLNKTVSQEHIDGQYNRLLEVIHVTWWSADPVRALALTKMYDMFKPRLFSAPASAKVHYHNAYPGGYLDHILKVIEASDYVTRLFRKLQGEPGFTESERIFAAMHHDLGKLGDEDGPYYYPENDPYWHKKGSRFKCNDEVQTMAVDDRTLYLLNVHDVKYTKNEMIGIRMANGMFSDAAKAYYETRDVFGHRSWIGYVIHWADWMATCAEKDQMMRLYMEQP